MVDWLLVGQLLEYVAGEILSDEKEILRQLDGVQERLNCIGVAIGEQTLTSARSGIRHLLDGLNSDLEDVKRDEFFMARQEFGKLVNLAPDGVTSGASGDVPNPWLIGVGYWGNWHYFNLRGDRRNAVMQVYECTRRFSDVSLNLFPSGFYSKDYFAAISTAFDRYTELCGTLHELERHNSWEKAAFAGKVGASVVGWAGGSIAAFMVGHWVGAVHCATKALDSPNKVEGPKLKYTKDLADAVARLEGDLSSLFIELDHECSSRLSELRKMSLNEFLARSRSARG